MPPAQQCLKASDFTTHQTHLRLIVQHEFTPCQRAAQLRFQFQACDRTLVHLRQVKLINRGSVFFGLKHCSVSISEQAIRVRTISGINANPETGGNIDFLTFQLEWQ